MSEELKKVREQLDAPIPRSAVSEREAGGGRSLSYVPGWYVIDRLNKIIGQGNWQYEAEDITRVYEGTTTNKRNQTGRAVAYTAKVRLTVEFGEKIVSFVDIGAGKGTDFNSGLEADESAVKEAVTDGLKRCAKNLGMSMGLALYDKSQENVSDEDESTNGTRDTRAAKAEKPKSLPTADKHSSPITPVRVTDNSSSAPPKTEVGSRKELNELISSTAKVVVARKNETVSSIKEHLTKTYGVDNKALLDDAKAEEFLTWLKGRINV